MPTGPKGGKRPADPIAARQEPAKAGRGISLGSKAPDRLTTYR
jgi:hypothetical protein